MKIKIDSNEEELMKIIQKRKKLKIYSKKMKLKKRYMSKINC